MSLREVRCPMCKGKLWIDLSSGKIVDHQPADRHATTFDEFVKQKKNPGWDDKMKKAREEQERRRAELEQKFKQARKDPGAIEGEGYENPFQWD